MDHEDRLFVESESPPLGIVDLARVVRPAVQRSWDSYRRDTLANDDGMLSEIVETAFRAGAQAGIEATQPPCPNPDCTRCVGHEGDCL